MKYIFTYILVALISAHLSAQPKHDYHWTIGYDTSSSTQVGNVILMDFNSNPVQVQTLQTVERMFSGASNTTMSDTSGNLLFYTSGCYVVNADHKIMDNGDSINTGIILQYYCPDGNSPNISGALAIPWPDSPNLYLLFVLDYESIVFPGETFTTTGASAHLYYNIIDMTKAGGLGAVTQKNQVLIADTLSRNGVKACRHANGRDWWVLVPVPRSNCYYITLISPDGPQSPQLICSGTSWNKYEAEAQAFFTPDNKKFIRFNALNGIHIHDFDNEQGILSNGQVIPTEGFSVNAVGAAASPNSRYLYIGAHNFLFQYDLEAPDIETSRILLLVRDNVPDPFVPSVFSLMALAPDGKIYISSVSSHLSLHIIHRPDCPGLYSLPERRGLPLTSWNYFSVPNLASYRNEPSNTPCDSMIVHTYTPIDGNKQVVLYPNPAYDLVQVLINRPLSSDAHLTLFDQLGRNVLRVELPVGQEHIQFDVASLSPGIYYYVLTSENIAIQNGKLVVGRL